MLQSRQLQKEKIYMKLVNILFFFLRDFSRASLYTSFAIVLFYLLQTLIIEHLDLNKKITWLPSNARVLKVWQCRDNILNQLEKIRYFCVSKKVIYWRTHKTNVVKITKDGDHFDAQYINILLSEEKIWIKNINFNNQSLYYSCRWPLTSPFSWNFHV